MKSTVVLWVSVALISSSACYATDVEGDVWGTWTRENSPYDVVGEIRVPPESTLVIEPGVVVDFQGHYKFIVDSLATLLAVGTQSDSIYFTTEDTSMGWHGIRFLYSDSSSQLSYCRLQHGKALGVGHDACGGGIYCYSCSVTISDCTIMENHADGMGGGIYCGNISVQPPSPVIINSTISQNSGEGIACDGMCGPVISGNVISDNSYCGIFSWSLPGPQITGNVIRGNSEGGIICYYSETTTIIANNVIKENLIHGGISCLWLSCPTIVGNLITGNVSSYGGGIYCDEGSSPATTRNTITGNTANSGGAIFCSWGSSPALVNNILWANSPPQIDTIFYARPEVTYCDVQGGWPGQGNIDADPIFAGPYNEDFQLRWHSPCIDAGDPDPMYNDPDGTRSDMGAFYFNQAVLGIVEVYPHDEPILIPPEGGDIVYDGWVFNYFGHPGRADIWTYAFVPEMGRYGPIDLYQNVRIPADSIGMNEITEHVPAVAPAGDYAFVAYVGDYPSTIIDSSCFYFTKTGSVAGGIADWRTLKGWFVDFASSEGSLPTHYSVSQNYPNPFNVRTVVNYQLPLDSHVKMEVYNALGQKVAILVDETQQPGYKSVIWDASNISSGLYFYKLTAGDFNETQRMMLVK